ncbi:hypothetical protein [Lysinibacillus boronitolerans]|uniref:hypothetical protein n=1 Tax=Lysinibacillus boronitolerans TaxID=309788 RepID=UPI0002DC045B|nr:hypothetical protein [Lysinibacillus boronitolerans]
MKLNAKAATAYLQNQLNEKMVSAAMAAKAGDHSKAEKLKDEAASLYATINLSNIGQLDPMAVTKIQEREAFQKKMETANSDEAVDALLDSVFNKLK